jgi:hypothetical protein
LLVSHANELSVKKKLKKGETMELKDGDMFDLIANKVDFQWQISAAIIH